MLSAGRGGAVAAVGALAALGDEAGFGFAVLAVSAGAGGAGRGAGAGACQFSDSDSFPKEGP